jgi:hypothetical protein
MSGRLRKAYDLACFSETLGDFRLAFTALVSEAAVGEASD